MARGSVAKIWLQSTRIRRQRAASSALESPRRAHHPKALAPQPRMAHVGAAFRDASPRADSAFYSSADPRPYITSACCTSRQRYEGQQTPWEQLACPALLRTVRYLRYGGPSRRRPIAYTQHMQSAAPPVRARARAPLTQPHRRYIRCCVVRPRHARRHGLPGPVLALHERECETKKQATRKTLRI